MDAAAAPVDSVLDTSFAAPGLAPEPGGGVGVVDSSTVRRRLPASAAPRLVHWVDSKAMFGDPLTHKDNLEQASLAQSMLFSTRVIFFMLRQGATLTVLFLLASVMLCDRSCKDMSTASALDL